MEKYSCHDEEAPPELRDILSKRKIFLKRCEKKRGREGGVGRERGREGEIGGGGEERRG